MAKFVTPSSVIEAELIRCKFWIQQEPVSNILIKLLIEPVGSRDSVVGIATSYELDD
jgi:hypothetical protein